MGSARSDFIQHAFLEGFVSNSLFNTEFFSAVLEKEMGNIQSACRNEGCQVSDTQIQVTCLLTCQKSAQEFGR